MGRQESVEKERHMRKKKIGAGAAAAVGVILAMGMVFSSYATNKDIEDAKKIGRAHV